jgi:predicted enzyme related to lactoylglutathione lyase
MDDAAIVALLSEIEPAVGEIPHPPFMAALPAAPVIEAGADVDAVDAWVKARGGWTHRTPAHLAGPGGERAALFFIVPKGHLLAGGGGGGGSGTSRPVRGAAVPPSPPMPRSAGAPPTPPARLAAADVMAFVATTDMAAARAFYERGLGLRLAGESPIACEFDANGTKLRVVSVGEAVVAPYTVLGWVVADIAATIRDLCARGIELTRYDGLQQDELGVWTAPGGALVAWFADPDGNVLSLTQF